MHHSVISFTVETFNAFCPSLVYKYETEIKQSQDHTSQDHFCSLIDEFLTRNLDSCPATLKSRDDWLSAWNSRGMDEINSCLVLRYWAILNALPFKKLDYSWTWQRSCAQNLHGDPARSQVGRPGNWTPFRVKSRNSSLDKWHAVYWENELFDVYYMEWIWINILFMVLYLWYQKVEGSRFVEISGTYFSLRVWWLARVGSNPFFSDRDHDPKILMFKKDLVDHDHFLPGSRSRS